MKFIYYNQKILKNGFYLDFFYKNFIFFFYKNFIKNNLLYFFDKYLIENLIFSIKHLSKYIYIYINITKQLSITTLIKLFIILIFQLCLIIFL